MRRARAREKERERDDYDDAHPSSAKAFLKK